MKTAVRFLALFLALCVLFALCFLAFESGHDCAGSGCPVCAAVQLCAGLAELFGLAAACTFIVFTTLHSVITKRFPDHFDGYRASPVLLKVLLLD